MLPNTTEKWQVQESHPKDNIFMLMDHNLVSTSENVALTVFKILEDKMPKNATLHRVRVSDYDNDFSEVFGS